MIDVVFDTMSSMMMMIMMFAREPKETDVQVGPTCCFAIVTRSLGKVQTET